jgi:hypothetical protein
MAGMYRYNRLKQIVESLNTDTRIRPTSWYTEHYSYLKEYYDAFEDFEQIHPDYDSNEFRDMMRQLNILLGKLMKEYQDHQWFGLYDYLKFNTILLKAIDYVCDSEDQAESELMLMLEGMYV